MSARHVVAARNPSRVRAEGSGRVGLAIIGGFAALAIAGPLVAPYRTSALSGRPLEPPGWRHLLGTNSAGQDIASQMIAGARVSLLVALLAGGGAVLIGALVGMTAGWLGGRTDAILMRVVDVLLALPKLPLMIVVAAYAGTGLGIVAAVIAFSMWPPSARVIRSQVRSLRRHGYLRAAVGFGASTAHVLRRHQVPVIAPILAAGLVAAAGRAVMLEAGLAFLGLSDPTRMSWGTLMRDALSFQSIFYTRAWAWWLLPPALAVALLLFGVTLLGVALEGRVDPRLARRNPAGSWA